METYSDLAYILLTSPVFILGITFLSYIFFNRINLIHIFFWSILAIVLSTTLSLLGEIFFGLIYAYYMSKTHNRSDVFWVFLFLEINLIIVNFQTLLEKSFTLSMTNNFFFISITSKLITNIVLLILAIWLFGTRKKIVNNMRHLVQEKDGIWISAIFYLGASCTVMYFLEFTFILLKLDNVLALLILSAFIFFMVVNLCSLFFILRSYRYYLELLVVKHTNESRRAYYASLNQQRENTSKLLHDYKNLLATLQLSLQQTSASQSSDTSNIIAQAQRSIQQAESGKDSLAAIESDPLRNLLYLKWSEATNSGIRLHIHTEGTIQPLSNNAGFAVIRALGILIDNALEESIRINKTHFSVLLVASDRGLEASVVNDINDDFNLAKFTEPGFTTKGRGHGNGLTIINELIQQNKNIIIKKTVINKQLKITLFIGR